ncbi:MAG: hypothetical protein HFG26_01925 [Provencibacterium sp.]|nr:hypothetical protein [Provencibacterium sp.]
MIAEFIGLGSGWIFEEAAYQGLNAFERELGLLQIKVSGKSKVENCCRELFYILRSAIQRSDIIFILGGLGTGDQRVTQHVLTTGLSIPLVRNQDAYQNASSYFTRQEKDQPFLEEYAGMPEGSIVFPNPNGPFTGSVLARKEQCIFSLPERPEELFPLLLDHVLPFLSDYVQVPLRTQSFSVWGAEPAALEALFPSPAEERLITACYLTRQHPARALIRLTAFQDGATTLEAQAKELRSYLEQSFPGCIFEAEEGLSMEAIAALCRKKGLRITGAEYGTDGRLDKALHQTQKWLSCYAYDLDSVSSKVLTKVFELPASFQSMETARLAAHIACSARAIEGSGLGIALCAGGERAAGYTMAATDGTMLLYEEKLAPAQIPMAAALLLLRFTSMSPSILSGAVSCEAFFKKGAQDTAPGRWKGIWKKILEG